MNTEGMNRIEVEPSELAGILTGEPMDLDEPVLLYCDDIDVAIVGPDGLKFVHCDRPFHGIHPRFADSEAYQKVRRYFKQPKKDKCDKCAGDGWIDAESSDGLQLVMMANALKMFRGIRLAQDGYKPEQLQLDEARGTVVSFLSGEHPPRASADGVAGEPGHADFIQQKNGDCNEH